MNNWYVTADRIGTPTGGGVVTHHESEAFKEAILDPSYTIISRSEMGKKENDPWGWDDSLVEDLNAGIGIPRWAHFYSGTFSKTIDLLKKHGSKITYTAAAHSIEESKAEHEFFGLQFGYPHLTDPVLWERYVRGYLRADALITPSTHSRDVMRSFGATNRIVVIPHGCSIPTDIRDVPVRFTVGYLGAIGPDKGLIYLLQAWRNHVSNPLHHDDQLVLAGNMSQSPFMLHLLNAVGGLTQKNVKMMGWVGDVSDFYNSISLYVQPSVSEGFGIEVLEAMAHNRCVLCSQGAGAADVVPEWYRFGTRNVEELTEKIATVRRRNACQENGWPRWQKIASEYTWDKIKARYVKLWKEVLNGDDSKPSQSGDETTGEDSTGGD